MIFPLTLRYCFVLLALAAWSLRLPAQFAPGDADGRALEAYHRLQTAGNGPDAAAYLEKFVRSRHPQSPPTPELSEVYHQLAFYHFPADMNRTAAYLNQAIELRETVAGVSDRQKAETGFLAAQVHYQLQHYQQALQLAELAHQLYRRVRPDTPRYAEAQEAYTRSLILAGLCASELRDYALAISYFEQARELERRFPEPTTRMMLTNQLAMVALRNEDFDKAIRAYLTANDLHRQRHGGDSPSYLNNVATVYGELGEVALADRYYDRALTAARRRDNTMGTPNPWVEYFQTLLLKGRHLYHTRRYEELIALSPLLGQYPAGDGEAMQRGLTGELYQFIANAHAQLGRFERADAAIGEAAQRLLEPLRLAGPADLPVVAGTRSYRSDNAFVRLLETYATRYRLAAAESDDPLPLLQKAGLAFAKIDSIHRRDREQLRLNTSVRLNDVKERLFTEEGIKLALERYELSGDRTDLWEAYRYAAAAKSNELRQFMDLTSLATRYGVSTALLDRKRELDVRQQTLEQQLANTPGPDAGGVRDSLLAVSRRNFRLRNAMLDDHTGLRGAVTEGITISEAELRAYLDDDLLMVEYFRGESTLYIFSLTAAGGVRYLTRPVLPDVDALAERALTDAGAATELYEHLVAPVLTDLPGRITRLQFIPDAELWPVPFAALTDREGRLLIENYAVSYAYSIRLLYERERGRVPDDFGEEFLGFGLSYADILDRLSDDSDRSAADRSLRDMGQLPYASQEVRSAADLTGGAVFLDAQATKRNFLKHGHSGAILHLAMHGFLADNPLESALVFAAPDSVAYDPLTIREILEHRFPTELTVLSACHTGSGPLESSEGMQSMGRAFTAAGSRATITSNWEANDLVTHDILLSFYARLREGLPKDVALQRAVKKYLSQATPAERQPRRWANLVVNGSIAPLPVRAGVGPYGWLAGGGVFLFAIGVVFARSRS